MKYYDFQTNRGNIHVSKIAIGSAMSMSRLSKEEYFKLYDLFLEKGGNCIDTARAYGDGSAEALVGEYFASRGNRDKFVISTKGCHPKEDGKSRLNREDMFSDFNESLSVLGTDFIDIYWIHKDDETHPVEDIIDNINILLKTGKVGVIGCSNWSISRIEAANTYACSSGQQGFSASQIQWSLAATLSLYFKKYTSLVMDDESYDWYLKNKMPIFSFSSQAQGFFPRVAANGLESLDFDMQKNYGSPENMRRLKMVLKIATDKNVPISAPVLAYLMNNKLPCIPIIGAENQEMLLQSLAAADLEMSADDSDRLYHAR